MNLEEYTKEVNENLPMLYKLSRLSPKNLVNMFEDMLKHYCVDETYNNLIKNTYTSNGLSMEFDPVNVIHIIYTKSYYDSIKVKLTASSCDVFVKKEHGESKLAFSMPFKHFVKIYYDENLL